MTTNHTRIFIFDEREENLEMYEMLYSLYLPLNTVVVTSDPADVTDMLQSKVDLIFINGCQHVELIRTAQSLQPATPIIFSSAMEGNIPDWLARQELKVFATIPKDSSRCITDDILEATYRALKVPHPKNSVWTSSG